MRAALLVLVVACQCDAPPAATVAARDAASGHDAAAIAVDARTSEPVPGMWLTQLSADGTQAILESLPGVRGARERVTIDLETMQVVTRAGLADEVPGTQLRRAGRPAQDGEPRFVLTDGEREVDGTLGYAGTWRRAGDELVILLHQVGLPTCFVRIAGSPAASVWRHCLEPGAALDVALSPHGRWGVWTTRDPFEDFMRVHTYNLADDLPGPVTRGLGVPLISDGGRVVMRGPSENCELRGETDVVCLRDQRLVVAPLPQGTSN